MEPDGTLFAKKCKLQNSKNVGSKNRKKYPEANGTLFVCSNSSRRAELELICRRLPGARRNTFFKFAAYIFSKFSLPRLATRTENQRGAKSSSRGWPREGCKSGPPGKHPPELNYSYVANQPIYVRCHVRFLVRLHVNICVNVPVEKLRNATRWHLRWIWSGRKRSWSGQKEQRLPGRERKCLAVM